MRISKDFFIKSSIYLILLRSPIILLTMSAYIVSDRRIFSDFLYKLFPFVIFILISIIFSISMGNEIGNIIGQTRDIFLTIIVAALLITACKYNDSDSTCYETIKKCFIIIAVAKLLMLAYAFATGVNVTALVKQVTEVWGIEMMTMGTTDSVVGRIQIPMDAATPYFLYFYTKELIEKRKINSFSTIIFSLLCFSMLLTFSRLMWFQTALFIIIAVLVEASMTRIIIISIVGIIVLALLMYFTPLGGMITSIIDSRINGQNINDASDIERLIQNRGIINEIYKYPVLGQGLGHYIPNLTRSASTKYLYETQSLSMVMVFGMLGVFIFLLLIFWLVLPREKKVYKYYGPVFFLFFWGACGSFNPFLFGASGGVILYLSARFNNIKFMLENNGNPRNYIKP
ncbi:hypothetical protein GCM10022405_07180 [Gibbsiella dentisursi]|uniref:O-antigen ligase n=1 Tax=Gibbsiella dentisursi TaxID=796890 RepID=A0ABP7KRN3_9GAMM